MLFCALRVNVTAARSTTVPYDSKGGKFEQCRETAIAFLLHFFS
jgi:hypothetical protein